MINTDVQLLRPTDERDKQQESRESRAGVSPARAGQARRLPYFGVHRDYTRHKDYRFDRLGSLLPGTCANLRCRTDLMVSPGAIVLPSP